MPTQLCLPLMEVEYKLNARSPRAIPEIVKDLLQLDPDAPSGLSWKVRSRNGKAFPGKPAGTKSNGNYYLVSIAGHGLFYAHRIAYFLQHGENPGNMVVRHLDNSQLVLGWQPENGQDEKGKSKGGEDGYKTKVMYTYNGKSYNLSKLCREHDLPYAAIYQKIRAGKPPGEVFRFYGLNNIVVTTNY